MQRKQHGADCKAKVALEAIKGLKTINELSSEHGVHPTQINQWKKQVLDELPGIFSSRRSQNQKEQGVFEEAKAPFAGLLLFVFS